jgi:hypothetical protein
MSRVSRPSEPSSGSTPAGIGLGKVEGVADAAGLGVGGSGAKVGGVVGDEPAGNG